MSTCCRTCDHRVRAISASSTRTLLDVTLITLTFSLPVIPSNSKIYRALNTFLNNIVDDADSVPNIARFTSWSPELDNPKTAVVLTTASEVCQDACSPIFDSVRSHLAKPVTVQHILLDYAIVSISASSHHERIAADIITLSSAKSGVAGAIGKRFGWDPSKSNLSSHMNMGGQVSFNKPGDLIRDFWAWAELGAPPLSPSSSTNSEDRGILKSTNSDEKNMAMFLPGDEEDSETPLEAETLVMLFQWSNHIDAERFKHPLQPSHGLNGAKIEPDFWDRHVAHPVRQLEGIGATVGRFKVELRGVEDRLETTARERSGSGRLGGVSNSQNRRLSSFWR